MHLQEYRNLGTRLSFTINQMQQDNIPVIFSSTSWYSLLKIQLSSMGRVGMKPLIVTTDTNLSAYLSHTGWIAISVHQSASHYEVTRRFKSDIYQSFMMLKERIVMHILTMNRNVLSLDTDVIFFQNFFPAFQREILKNDIVGQGVLCDRNNSCRVLCGGIRLFKSTESTIRALQSAISKIDKGWKHQDAIDQMMKRYRLRMSLIGPDKLPNLDQLHSYCYGSVVGIVPNSLVAIHATVNPGWKCTKRFAQKLRTSGHAVSTKLEELRRIGIQ